MRTIEELESVINNHIGYFGGLYDRWQDEKEYEDFSDYQEAVKKKFPEFDKMTKRPFRIFLRCKDGKIRVNVTSRAIRVDKAYMK